MEQLTDRLADQISNALDHDKNQRAVFKYGLIAMIQVFSILLTIACIGLLLDCFYECFLIFLGVGYLRKSTGGIHSSTMRGCYIISCISIVLLALGSIQISHITMSSRSYLLICLLIYMLCGMIIAWKAPVDSAKKPITSMERRLQLRKKSLYTMLVYMAWTIGCMLCSSYWNRLYSFAAAICFATLWQTFTLTKVGAYLLGGLDRLLN